MGSAQYCYFPYSLRLQVMRLITIYWKMIFMRLPMNEYKKNARKLVWEEAKLQLLKIVFASIVIFLIYMAPQGFRDFFEPYRTFREVFWTTFAAGYFLWDMYLRIRDLWLAQQADMELLEDEEPGAEKDSYEVDKILEDHAKEMEKDLNKMRKETEKKRQEVEALKKKIK